MSVTVRKHFFFAQPRNTERNKIENPPWRPRQWATALQVARVSDHWPAPAAVPNQMGKFYVMRAARMAQDCAAVSVIGEWQQGFRRRAMPRAA